MNMHERNWPSEGLTRIPYWIYSDRDLYAEEQARIFRGDTWTFMCLEAEVPRVFEIGRVLGMRTLSPPRSLD